MKEKMSSHDNIEDISEFQDEDQCNNVELNKLFTDAELRLEHIIAKNKYILHLGMSSEIDPNVAIALSDYSSEIYSVSNSRATKIVTLSKEEDKLVGCKFSSYNSSLVYIGCGDGNIKLWDLRSPKEPSLRFMDSTTEGKSKRKKFNSFDFSPNEMLLATGTDLIAGDSYLLFWDVRNTNLLGAYWESHTDDITEVKFHPNDSNKLVSGSTDGLINLYNLSEKSEEDALQDSLNTESSVQQLSWYKQGNSCNISCITHTNDLQLWNLDKTEPINTFNRSCITREMQRKNESYTYLESFHPTKTQPIILAGSNANEGECFRSLLLKGNKLVPAFKFTKNTQRIRSSCYNENVNILFTGGEKGILNMWKIDLNH